MFLNKISRFMYHHRYFQDIILKIRDIDSLFLLYKSLTLPRGNTNSDPQQALQFRQFCKLHEDDLRSVYVLFEDDFSKYTFQRVLEYRCASNQKSLKDVFIKPQYFQRDIFGPVEDEVFVDGGAYTGDTVKQLVKSFGGGQNYCKKIYAWEPDSQNMKATKRILQGFQNIQYVPMGLWNERAELHFSDGGTGTSRLESEGNSTVLVDSIDNICSDEKITFIKMDIEGAEVMALNGASNVIRRDHPRLAICVYHKPEDIYTIPLLLKEMVPEYKLYLRHHTFHAGETVVYATL